MAHTPEIPEQYVCTVCQVMHAGTVSAQIDGGHQYDPPEECGCCGATELVAQEMWPNFDR